MQTSRATRRAPVRAGLVEKLERRSLLDAVPVGPEFHVNTYTTGQQFQPATVMHADGHFVVAWTGRVAGEPIGNAGIFAQRYSAAGVPLGEELRVSPPIANVDINFDASIAMDATGRFVVAWTARFQPSFELEIYARRFSATGVPDGNAFAVNTYTDHFQSGSTAAMDADGDFVLAWSSVGQDGSDTGVYARRYDAAGTPQGVEFLVNTQTIDAQAEPSVAMRPDGSFVAAWSAADGADYDVFARRFDATGMAQGGEFRVNTHTTDVQRAPSAATDNDGDFVVAWQSKDQDGSNYGVYAQRYGASGIPQGQELHVNTHTNNVQAGPSVAMDAGGGFVIAWTGNEQDGSGRGVYGQAFDAAGAQQGGEFRANTYTTNNQQVPAVAMDADGDCVIAWTSEYAQDGSSDGVFAQRYATTVRPTVTASSFTFETSPHRLRFTFDQNVSASLGLDDFVVQQLPAGPTVTPSGLTYDTATNTATVTFAGVLADGRYRATLLAAGVTNPSGTPLPSDHVLDFFFLNGDANHDERVNLDDFNVLAANFGQSGRDFTQADFTYDGVVNLDDFNVLASRFGTNLPAARGGSAGGGRDVPDDDDTDDVADDDDRLTELA
jgi:hypothetical protein